MYSQYLFTTTIFCPSGPLPILSRIDNKCNNNIIIMKVITVMMTMIMIKVTLMKMITIIKPKNFGNAEGLNEALDIFESAIFTFQM